jgi:hypothetical protein
MVEATSVEAGPEALGAGGAGADWVKAARGELDAVGVEHDARRRVEVRTHASEVGRHAVCCEGGQGIQRRYP